MKDDFEKRLNDRITEVFDNFEDAFADASWDLLREKYPEKKKRRGVIWLWMGSAAAILLLLLGLGIWSGNRQQKSNKLAAKAQNHHQITVDTAATSSHNKNNVAAASSEITSQEQSQQTNQASQVQSRQAAQLSKVNAANVVASSKSTPGLSGKQSPLVASGKIPQQTQMIVNEPEKTSTSKNNEQQSTAENSTVAANSSPTANPLTDTSAKKNIAQNDSKPVKPLVKSPFTENDPVVKKAQTAQKADNSKTVTLGVYAATYLNYSSGSSSTVNVGAGVASDVKLAKNLKLSTGLAINQNNLNFGNHIPVSNGLVASSTSLSYLVLNPVTTTSATASYSIPVLKNYSAQLTSLDVPLNLKYEFNPEQNSSFISLGLSSGTFITETYNSQYGYTNSANQTQSSNTSSFNNFYFAKTLDFSFGLGYPIGKNHLSVEPFVKYPLQGLGAEQIRFGAGGLNLKFNFSNNKK